MRKIRWILIGEISLGQWYFMACLKFSFRGRYGFDWLVVNTLCSEAAPGCFTWFERGVKVVDPRKFWPVKMTAPSSPTVFDSVLLINTSWWTIILLWGKYKTNKTRQINFIQTSKTIPGRFQRPNFWLKVNWFVCPIRQKQVNSAGESSCAIVFLNQPLITQWFIFDQWLAYSFLFLMSSQHWKIVIDAVHSNWAIYFLFYHRNDQWKVSKAPMPSYESHGRYDCWLVLRT